MHSTHRCLSEPHHLLLTGKLQMIMYVQYEQFAVLQQKAKSCVNFHIYHWMSSVVQQSDGKENTESQNILWIATGEICEEDVYMEQCKLYSWLLSTLTFWNLCWMNFLVCVIIRYWHKLTSLLGSYQILFSMLAVNPNHHTRVPVDHIHLFFHKFP
jgi:hypothetical protein